MTNSSKSADIQLIKRIIPHRYPFLLVDKVIEIDGLKSAKGIKNITFNEPQFQGHFPSLAIMPGIMIVEALAQTAAVMVGVSLDLADKNLLIYFESWFSLFKEKYDNMPFCIPFFVFAYIFKTCWSSIVTVGDNHLVFYNYCSNLTSLTIR